jgi:MSHA biogenesis protein MshQ
MTAGAQRIYSNGALAGQASCASAFSYQGQPMGVANTRPPSLAITSYNRAGGLATLSTTGAGDGDGRRAYSWSGEQLLFQPAALPSRDD